MCIFVLLRLDILTWDSIRIKSLLEPESNGPAKKLPILVKHTDSFMSPGVCLLSLKLLYSWYFQVLLDLFRT